MKTNESKKVAAAILSGLTNQEKVVLYKIISSDEATVLKELGHGKEDSIKAFARVSLERIRQNENI